MGTLFDIWGPYNLREDPYFVQALTKDKLDLLRGKSRIDAAREVEAHVFAGGSPLLLLESGPGVGKTTLVNFVKRDLEQSGSFFVYPNTIEISADSTREALAAEFLSAMTVAAVTAEPEGGWERDARWLEASRMIADSIQRAGLGGTISFSGFGLGFSSGQARTLARVIPWESWKGLAENVLNAMRERRRGFVVHLNNIDAVSDTAPEKVRQIFDETRELLLLPGLCTIIAASSSFREDVLAERTRLLDVITPVAQFKNLAPDEFCDVVHARYAWFKRDGTGEVIPPVADAALVELYSRFDGDLRNTFTVAKSSVIHDRLAGNPASTLSFDRIMELFLPRLTVMFSQLAASERKVMEVLLAEKRVPSQNELVKKTKNPQPTVSHATRRLGYKRWIRAEPEGARTVYSLTGYGLLFEHARAAGLVTT